MDKIRSNIANNIIKLRQSKGMTQADLADALNYTDKAISKWERGTSVPDIFILKQVADIFSVTVDELISDCSPLPVAEENHDRKNKQHLLIALISAAGVWFLSVCLFVLQSVLSINIEKPLLIFISAIPISLIVLLVFNCIWGKGIYNFVLISLLLWSILIEIFLIFESAFFILFFIGVPAQVIICLTALLYIKSKKTTKRRK